MTQSVLDRTGEQIAETARKTTRMASAFADAIEDGVGAARRAAKHGGDVAEELFDDASKRVQRHPVETVAVTFVTGIAVGVLIGWMAKRRHTFSGCCG